jgi:SAM-dependent methyltransferase
MPGRHQFDKFIILAVNIKTVYGQPACRSRALRLQNEHQEGSLLTGLQYRILMKIAPGLPDTICTGSAYRNKSKLEILLGTDLLERVRGKTVIDFGCGEGAEAIELAGRGAARVIGIDIRETCLETARRNAACAGVADRCDFVRHTGERADYIVSIDSFEHFRNPAGILARMAKLLRPEGEVLAAFGPTWYHPLGGHLFSIFPWCHLLFSQDALIRWRSNFHPDGATRFTNTDGGLNRMTIRRFERLIAASPFEVALLELRPIRKLRRLHNRLTREFTTAIVRCRLAKRTAP